MKRSSVAQSLATFGARLLIALTLAVGATHQAQAAPNPPDRLSYNGNLADANGVPLANGGTPQNFEVQFRIYNASQGGNVLWAETQTVTVDSGNFSVLLGEGSEIDGELRPSLASVFTGADVSDRYLGTTVVGLGGEIAPRLRFLTSPFTFLATNALNIVGATGGQGIVVVDGAIRTSGGDARGDRAVDLQARRDTPDRVAGGAASTIGGGHNNKITVQGSNGFWGIDATIGGGYNNEVTADAGTIGGGHTNLASGISSTIGGGHINKASGWESFVGGGRDNEANSDQTTIGGGESNIASGHEATVAGGFQNQATQQGANVGGGTFNEATATNATVGGGWTNKAQGVDSTISGGTSNIASGNHSNIGGGFENQATGANATVAGGYRNQATGLTATVAGGAANKATAHESFIGGGGINTASGARSSVMAGLNNVASGENSSIGGGSNNAARGVASSIGGGNGNVAENTESFVGAGGGNKATGNYSAVAGGLVNEATGVHSFVGGGHFNWATGLNATVPGGWDNHAQGIESFAAGRRARALHDGAFVWGDRSSDAYVDSEFANQFKVRASEVLLDTPQIRTSGVLDLYFSRDYIGVTPTGSQLPQHLGVIMRSPDNTSNVWTIGTNPSGHNLYINWGDANLHGNGGSWERAFLAYDRLNWQTPSDRRLKTDIRPVGNALDRIREIPVVYYKMKSEGENAVTQVGTIAQDVYEVLPEAVSSTGEYMGVDYSLIGILAAGAVTELADQKDAEIAELQEQNDRLNQRVDDLLERLERLESVVVNQ